MIRDRTIADTGHFAVEIHEGEIADLIRGLA
jgi:hypothetical protein